MKPMRIFELLTVVSLAVASPALPCLAADESADWFYNPFSRASAHHRPIGSGAIYAGNDHPAVRDFLKGSALNINVGNKPWGCGIWESKAEDPLFTVTYGGRDDGGRPAEFPVTCRLPLNLVMQQERNAGGNFDGVLVVYDRASRIFRGLVFAPKVVSGVTPQVNLLA